MEMCVLRIIHLICFPHHARYFSEVPAQLNLQICDKISNIRFSPKISKIWWTPEFIKITSSERFFRGAVARDPGLCRVWIWNERWDLRVAPPEILVDGLSPVSSWMGDYYWRNITASCRRPERRRLNNAGKRGGVGRGVGEEGRERGGEKKNEAGNDLEVRW